MSGVLQRVEDLKNQTGLALARLFDGLELSGISEKALATAWHETLQSDPALYPEGWYAPPPHGIIMVFGKPEDRYKRVCQSSYRTEPMWPGETRIYDEQDIISLYASPVDRQTSLIGDFGLNLYRGDDPEIKDHFKNVLQSGLHIASLAKVGMPFSDLYRAGMEYGRSKGFSNSIDSYTDAAGTNMGHTIPLSYASDKTIDAVARVRSFEEVQEALRTGRKFVSAEESQRIEENMAFTIEPRFATSSLPNTLFHLTVIFENGQRHICHGFKPVLEKFGMDYLLPLLP